MGRVSVIAFSRTSMVAMWRRMERSLTPMGFLEVWLLPRWSHLLVRFHIAADLRVDMGDDFVCSNPCLAVDSPDDTLEAFTSIEILLGKIDSHCLLFHVDLIFEVLQKILHPVQFG